MIIDANGTPQPYLAQSVTPNTDYTVWTITLRPNLVFHNGTPCDAAAVAANFEAHKAAVLTGPALTTIESVVATGPLVTTITMKSPWVPFDYYLTGGIGSQFAFVAEPNWLGSGSQTNPIGTGPFVFQEWVPNDHFTATKNPHYWRPGLPYLDSITYKPIPDPSSLLTSLESGSVDIMHTDTAIEIERAPRQRLVRVHRRLGERRRRAGHGLPPAQPVQAPLQQSEGAPGHGLCHQLGAVRRGHRPRGQPHLERPFTTTSPYYLADNGYPVYDLAKAKQLVQEVQQETGQPVSFTLNHIPDPSTTRIAEYLQQQLQTAGMTVTLSPVQQESIINIALAGTFEAQVWRQFGAVNPDLNYIFWSPTNASTPVFAINMARNTDPAMETALLKGRQSTNPSDQVAAYQQVSRLLGADLPYIWYDRTVWAIGAHAKVQNFKNPTTPAGGKAFGMIGGAIWPTQIWKT